MAVVKRRMSKADKWMVALSELSARYGVALMEIYDGARITDGKTGKELGRSLAYVCGLYTAHKPRIAKNIKPSPGARDVQGFVRELNVLSDELSVRLKLRSAPVMLVTVDTMEPVARLVSTASGFSVEDLLAV